LLELGVREDKPGLIKSDIQINLSGHDNAQIMKAIQMLEENLTKIAHVKDVSDNVQMGKMEYKLKINDYGERLGFTEAGIARALAGFFLDNRRAMTFSESGVMEIKTRALRKDEERTLQKFELMSPEGKSVRLMEVVDIIK